MKHILCMILAICALLLPWTAAAEEDDPFLIAMSSAAEVSRNGADDLESIRQAAEQGNAEAQNKLGCFYLFGSGVPVDRKEALKWFRKAADRGLADAQFNLGCCCEYGRGIKKDEAKAVELYKKAAEQGYAPAQFQLGLCLSQGIGALPDKYDAVEWYRKAAEQGHANAQVNLAFCYEKGLGVEKDENQVRKWFLKAAAQGNEQGREKILLMENESVTICFHHPKLKLTCEYCKGGKDPFFGVDNYKGKNVLLCRRCLALPHCQYCRFPAVFIEENNRLCRYCLRDVIGKQLEVEAVLQEVRDSLKEEFRMSTDHEIDCGLGTRSELGLNLEDDPQKLSLFESETVDGVTRYKIRLLTNLPQDIFRIAAAQALAQDWLEENEPKAMDDPDLREGFSLYVARLLTKSEQLSRTKKVVKRLSEDGRYVSTAKLLRNKTSAADWRKTLKTEFREDTAKMPAKKETDDKTPLKRADVLKESQPEVLEQLKESRIRDFAVGNGFPRKPQLPPPQTDHENDLVNTQSLLRNGLRRANQREQPPPPTTRENDLSRTQNVLRNGLRRD